MYYFTLRCNVFRRPTEHFINCITSFCKKLGLSQNLYLDNLVDDILLWIGEYHVAKLHMHPFLNFDFSMYSSYPGL